MARRWGSYTSDGKVLLNPRLIEAPREAIYYVCVHELCHRISRKHDTRFYLELEKRMPEWRRIKESLEINFGWGCMLRICTVIKPNSKADSIEKVGDELLVRVKAPAVDGKANEAAVKLIAKYYDVPKTRVKLIRGATSRKKVFEITWRTFYVW